VPRTGAIDALACDFYVGAVTTDPRSLRSIVVAITAGVLS